MQDQQQNVVKVCRRVMTQLFDSPEIPMLNVLRFRSAGSVMKVPAAMNAQEWANDALDGVKLKAPYADISVSGLLLLRDTLMTSCLA